MEKKSAASKIFLWIWYAALLCLVGAVFNATVAIFGLFYKWLALVVPTLTGYALFKLFQGSKLNESFQSYLNKSGEQSQQSKD